MEIWPLLFFGFDFFSQNESKWDGFAREILFLVSFWLTFEEKTDTKELRLQLKSDFWCYFGSDSSEKRLDLLLEMCFFYAFFQHFFEMFFDNFGFGKIRFNGRKQLKTWSFVVKKKKWKTMKIVCSMGILMKNRFSGKYAKKWNRPKS